jgi:transposase
VPHFAGLDVSKRTTAVCVIDDAGTVVDEAIVSTNAKSLIAALRGRRRRYGGVGLEATGPATWLQAELAKAHLPAVLIEVRHAHRVLSAARLNKTDRNDARGIAELMRAGTFRPVHAKSPESQRLKALLAIRKALVQRQLDLESCLRGVLAQRGLGLDARRSPKHYTRRILRLPRNVPTFHGLIEPLALAHDALGDQIAALTDQAVVLARNDPICRRLMTAPAVGPLTALEFRAAIDDPARFRRSRDVGAYLGLTPRTHQSGDVDWRGGISRRGDAGARRALYNAARTLLFRMSRPSVIRSWGLSIAARKGKSRAMVAVARRLAVTLHRMWMTQSDFEWNPIGAGDMNGTQ